MRTFLSILSALLLLTLSACSRDASSSPQTANQSRQSEEPTFAVFSPAIGVMLRDLGFEDDIVGRHSFDSALSESIPVVGTHIEIDDEMLITLDPSILIFEENSIAIPERIREMAESRGWSIWTYQLRSLDDVAQTMDDLYLKLVGFPSDANSDGDPTTFEVDPTKRFHVELPSARLARSWAPMGPDAQIAGRTLLLAGTDPAGALGLGSFHAQMIERMGIIPALQDGGMWQELDLEDLITLAPDSILIFSPQNDTQAIGEPEPMGWDEIEETLGPIASLDLPALRTRRVGVITHPQGLLPSSTLSQVADEIRETLAHWRERSAEP
ncbi:MAG: substrate-binding domain-containing protein [Phycisphaerales bacterium]